MTTAPPFDWPCYIRLAALSGVDPKTVRRVVEGKPTRPTTRTRVWAALLECGLSAYVPDDESRSNEAQGPGSGQVRNASEEPESP